MAPTWYICDIIWYVIFATNYAHATKSREWSQLPEQAGPMSDGVGLPAWRRQLSSTTPNEPKPPPPPVTLSYPKCPTPNAQPQMPTPKCPLPNAHVKSLKSSQSFTLDSRLVCSYLHQRSGCPGSHHLLRHRQACHAATCVRIPQMAAAMMEVRCVCKGVSVRFVLSFACSLGGRWMCCCTFTGLGVDFSDCPGPWAWTLDSLLTLILASSLQVLVQTFPLAG